jgi:hypothetical protein
MKPVAIAPRAMLEKKAPHGSACTHCGLCCHVTLCDIGFALFKNKSEPAAFGMGPCPALRFDENGSRCGVVDESKGKMREAALLILYSGLGCDARFNGEPANMDFYDKLERWDNDYREQIAEARKLWRI